MTQTTPEQRALRKASLVAMKTGTRPSIFRSIVTKSEAGGESYRRVAHNIERRTVALQVTPGHGTRKQDIRPIPDAGAVDPWSVDPNELPSATACVATCPTCHGHKKVVCPTCSGSAQLRCGTCGGGGKVAGKRGSKNCPSCRGRGAVRCHQCSKGRVECPSCGKFFEGKFR